MGNEANGHYQYLASSAGNIHLQTDYLKRSAMSSLVDEADNDGDETSHLALTELQRENDALAKELEALQGETRQLHNVLHQVQSTTLTEWRWKVEDACHQQSLAFDALESQIQQRERNERLLADMQTWTTLNDCFFIATQGPFATINGLRLGAEAITETLVPESEVESASANQQSNNHNSNSNSSGNWMTRSGSTESFPTNPRGGNTSPGSTSAQPSSLISSKVPWSEINSALGQLALLLSILSENFDIPLRYHVVPNGSTSKMGIPTSRGSATYYHLFSDDSFQFFGRRQFHTALACLLATVVDIAHYVQSKDPTIVLPHPMDVKGSSTTTISGGTVGGLALTFHNGVEWTRAMKYLLTNVKHLLLFRPFHLWNIDGTKNASGERPVKRIGAAANKK